MNIPSDPANHPPQSVQLDSSQTSYGNNTTASTEADDPPDQIQTRHFDPVGHMPALITDPQDYTSNGGRNPNSSVLGPNPTGARVATIVFIYDATIQLQDGMAEWVEGTGLVTIRLPYSDFKPKQIVDTSISAGMPTTPTSQVVNTSISNSKRLAYTHVHMPNLIDANDKDEDIIDKASNVVASVALFARFPAAFSQFLTSQPNHHVRDMDTGASFNRNAPPNPSFNIVKAENPLGLRFIVQKIYTGSTPTSDDICGKSTGRVPNPTGPPTVEIDTIWLTKYFVKPPHLLREIIDAGDKKYQEILNLL